MPSEVGLFPPYEKSPLRHETYQSITHLFTLFDQHQQSLNNVVSPEEKHSEREGEICDDDHTPEGSMDASLVPQVSDTEEGEIADFDDVDGEKDVNHVMDEGNLEDEWKRSIYEKFMLWILSRAAGRVVSREAGVKREREAMTRQAVTRLLSLSDQHNHSLNSNFVPPYSEETKEEGEISDDEHIPEDELVDTGQDKFAPQVSDTDQKRRVLTGAAVSTARRVVTENVASVFSSSSTIDVVKAGVKKKRGAMTQARKEKRRAKRRKQRAEQNKQSGVEKLQLEPRKCGVKKLQLEPRTVNYCRFFLLGKCQRGDACKFSHDTTPVTKAKPCNFHVLRKCLKGDDCPYDHELFKYPCNNYKTKGFCSRGDSCRFSHKMHVVDDPSHDISSLPK